MKITCTIPKKKAEPRKVSATYVVDNPGVYMPANVSYQRVITIKEIAGSKKLSLFCENSNLVEPFLPECWRNTKFIILDENIHVDFKEKTS